MNGDLSLGKGGGNRRTVAVRGEGPPIGRNVVSVSGFEVKLSTYFSPNGSSVPSDLASQPSDGGNTKRTPNPSAQRRTGVQSLFRYNLQRPAVPFDCGGTLIERVLTSSGRWFVTLFLFSNLSLLLLLRAVWSREPSKGGRSSQSLPPKFAEGGRPYFDAEWAEMLNYKAAVGLERSGRGGC